MLRRNKDVAEEIKSKKKEQENKKKAGKKTSIIL